MHWGLIELMGPVRESTGASLNSWPLWVSTGAHWLGGRGAQPSRWWQLTVRLKGMCYVVLCCVVLCCVVLCCVVLCCVVLCCVVLCCVVLCCVVLCCVVLCCVVLCCGLLCGAVLS